MHRSEFESSRVADLLRDLALANADLLILDDWATAVLMDEQRRDLFEILEDRYECHATLIAAQLALEHWYEIVGYAPILSKSWRRSHP